MRRFSEGLALSKHAPCQTLRPSNTPPGRPPPLSSLGQPRHLNARGVYRPAEGVRLRLAARTFAGLGGDVRTPRGPLPTLPGTIDGTWQHRVLSSICGAHRGSRERGSVTHVHEIAMQTCLAAASARLRYPVPRQPLNVFVLVSFHHLPFIPPCVMFRSRFL